MPPLVGVSASEACHPYALAGSLGSFSGVLANLFFVENGNDGYIQHADGCYDTR